MQIKQKYCIFDPISVRMTEKADIAMDQLLQQENIRTSVPGGQLIRTSSGTNAPLTTTTTKKVFSGNQPAYLYQPANTNTQNFILASPQPNTATNLNTTSGVGQTQRIVSTTPATQTQVGSGSAVNQNPGLAGNGQYYVVGPPVSAENLPPQFRAALLAQQPNQKLISGGSFAAQPQQLTTTTQQKPVVANQINQPNSITSIPVPTQSNPNIPVTTTTITQPPVVVATGSAGNANQFVGRPVGGNQPVIGTTTLPRTVTQITQSRLSGEAPVYHGVINQSQATATALPSQTNLQTQQPVVGSFNSTSKIQYVPFNRKIIEYEQKQTVQMVPKTKKVTEYREETVYDMVARQAVKQDYYAVQYIKQYVAEYIPEKKVNMVKRAVPFKRIEYVPVTRQVYHGAPLGEEGSQMVPFCCDKTLDRLNQVSHGHLPWQTGVGISGTSLHQSHNFYGGYPGGYLSAGCCDQFKRKFNNLYDNYEPYIPSFKY